MNDVPQRRLADVVGFDGDLLVDPNTEGIVRAVLDLAYYRTLPAADDLARSVAFELEDRVGRLPEIIELHQTLEPPPSKPWWRLW